MGSAAAASAEIHVDDDGLKICCLKLRSAGNSEMRLHVRDLLLLLRSAYMTMITEDLLLEG